MAEENSTPNSEDRDESDVSIPTRASLPPPPVVNYTRPVLGKSRNNVSGETHVSRYKNVEDSGKRRDLFVGAERPGIGNIGMGLAAGLTFAASVVVGIYIGNWIDARWHTGPWGLIIMLVVGVAAGFVKLVRLLDAPGKRRK
jgi:hypothetical protein